ncbi:2-oxo acid dehydrogenase subunit E2 [Bacillus licheniformis]|nr:2-oxo acid dehydrogenase subunit E2 [Bacillus licheniformis]
MLNPPETGILGVGQMYSAPVYQDGELTKGAILPLSLTLITARLMVRLLQHSFQM